MGICAIERRYVRRFQYISTFNTFLFITSLQTTVVDGKQECSDVLMLFRCGEALEEAIRHCRSVSLGYMNPPPEIYEEFFQQCEELYYVSKMSNKILLRSKKKHNQAFPDCQDDT